MRSNRQWIPTITLALLLALPVMSAQVNTAFAHEGHQFYVGVQVPVERVNTSYDKTVDNTNASNPRSGQVFHDNDSDDTFAYGIGFLVGHRIPLLTKEDGYYVSAEVDIAFHGGQAKGQLPGKGESPGRNQPGESWPDRWSFQKNRSYGFTIKLGGSPGVLRSWDTSVYVLGGIRLIQAQFQNHYRGCLSDMNCTSTTQPEFVSGTNSRNLDYTAWTYGAGVEKMLSEHLGLRIEARYTQYNSKRWVELFDTVGVRVPTQIDADDVGMLMSLAWYF
ncbi:MAG: outer membrane beta-barrel protein [Nitrospira sp. SB0662_bin_26]|nr:outer membrane beta-barrel protein [Nitrospira sp. SB0662_bin_26]